MLAEFRTVPPRRLFSGLAYASQRQARLLYINKSGLLLSGILVLFGGLVLLKPERIQKIVFFPDFFKFSLIFVIFHYF